jgi:similar to stage IV sporulation protein
MRWWLEGYVDLRVRAERPEGLINRLLADGVRFRVRPGGERGFALRLPVGDFRRMRPAARAGRARVRVHRRTGLPFTLARLRRRPALVAAALVAAVGLYTMSGFVWFVQVRGADRVAPEEVLAAAAALGLHPGTRRSALDPQAIARRLPTEVPDIAWAAVSVQGILARVTVAERVRQSPGYAEASVAGDVVAAHAGRIWAITTVSGTAQVRAGDEVAAGQVLIRGVVQMPVSRSRGGGVEGIQAVPVHASGIVIARRWYSTYAEAGRTVDLGTPTGRVAERHVLVLGGLRLAPQGWLGPPFAAYELEQSQWGPLEWGPLRLPLHVLTLRYTQVTPHYRRLTLDEARALATAEARAYLLTVIPRGARLVAQQETWQVLPGGAVGVELHVESEDNIGVFRPSAPSATGSVPGAG